MAHTHRDQQRLSFTDRLVAGGFGAAWKTVPKMPARMAYSMFDDIASATYIKGGPGVDRLRANYSRARPEVAPQELESLVRRGLASYMRYWCEVFRQSHLTDDQLRMSVRGVGVEPVRAALARGESVIGLLPHMGNWDAAGAWAQIELGRVVTVAERVKPEAVFDGFMRMRQHRGVTIYPLTGGGDVLRKLAADAATPTIVPLLGDRDLTGGGVEVDFLGGRASFAMGPAVLALRSTGRLVPISIHYERVERAVVPCGYRTVVTFHDAVLDPGVGRTRDRVAAMTQGCADVLGEAIRAHTENWHMMQPIFLDAPERPPAARTNSA